MALIGTTERVPEQSYQIRQSGRYYEHRDSQATAMCVDWSGEWALLAGRRHLVLQYLGDSDDSRLLKYYRNSKYDVSAAEFDSCGDSQKYCAIAASQHIDVVVWGGPEPQHFFTLRGHTRLVTDIDWHSKNPFILSSCSIDTFSHIWDLREPRKPMLSLSAVCMSGATQVGFNRITAHLLAAAHDGDLRIWDIRKGSCPIHYITAHQNRVHGINWSHRRETCLATASQDGTVKYFDINMPRRAEKIITTSSPVWRARYTPIGNGLVTIVVPHLGRGENSLLLWSNSKQTDPVCSFIGHTDVILDFAWRPNHENRSEIELVTWSRDRSLRVWQIDEMMLRLCEPSDDFSDLTLESIGPSLTNQFSTMLQHSSSCDFPLSTPTTATASTLLQLSTPLSGRGVPVITPLSPSLAQEEPEAHLLNQDPSIVALDALQITTAYSPPLRRDEPQIARSLTDQPTCSLHHEFSLLNTNIPHVEVISLDALKRQAFFKISAGGHVLILQVTFPTQYPSPYIAPEFHFCDGSSLYDHHISKGLLKLLRVNALQRVKRSRTCLEQCLRALVTALKKENSGSEKSQLRLQSPRLEGALSGTLPGACIPFPRTSCARFSAAGQLTIFAQLLNSQRLSLRRTQNVTPRTLSAINGGGLLGPQPVLYAHRDSNASFYLPDRMSKNAKARSLQKAASVIAAPLVHIYDATRAMSISREMAQEYTMDKRNTLRTCMRNLEICLGQGRNDIASIWSLAALIATPRIPDDKQMDAAFYCDDPFKASLINTLVLHYVTRGDLQTAVVLACVFHRCLTSEKNDSLLNTTRASIAKSRQRRFQSYSWSETFNMSDVERTLLQSDPVEVLKSSRSNPTSEQTQIALFDCFKRAYAVMLFSWKLPSERALILKHTADSQSISQGQEFQNQSALLGYYVDYCAICSLPVKGLATACVTCGHGGHFRHMLQWFTKHTICARGCGCHCLMEATNLNQ